MAKWKEKTNPDAFIRKIEKTRSVTDDGKVQFTGWEIMTLPRQLESVVELNSSITPEDKHGIVWKTIRNVGRKEALSSKNVLTEIIKLEKEYLSLKEDKFVLISTLSINSKKNKLPNVQIDHNRITFSPKAGNKYIIRMVNDTHIQYYLRNKKIPTEYTWARIAVSARSTHDAVQKALGSLNLFRAALNYIINYNSRSFSFGNKPKPINKVLYGPIHTLHKLDGKLAEDYLWYEEECFEMAQAYCSNPKDFEDMMKYFSNLRKQLSKSKIRNVLQDGILLYNSALDSYSFDTAFIKLWATLELLTGTNPKDSYDTTIKRTKFIFKNVEIENDLLEILRKCRNDIVHRGYMDGQRQTLLDDLKLYVESLINFLLWDVQELKSFEEIKTLLDSSPNRQGLLLGERDLKNKLKINSFARKLRE